MLFCSLPGLNFTPSVICLGVAEFGSSVSLEDSMAMLDTFVEADGNFADTAHVYAAWLPDGWGQSERALGEWLRQRRPENFFIATKGGHPDLKDMRISRLSPECIAQDLQESLERLQVDSVDLYWLHRDDPAVPVGEIMEALNELLRAGRIRALGASNWSTTRIAEANQYAAKRGLSGFCASQIGWSLAEVNPEVRGAALTVQMDDEIMTWHRETDFPIMAYTSQANGFFAYPLPDPNSTMTPKQQALARSFLNEKNSARHARATQLANELSCTPNEVALAYIWSQSFPAVAIIGTRRHDHLTESLRAADLRLTPEQVAFLENNS